MAVPLERYRYLILDFDRTIVNLLVDWKGLKGELSHAFGRSFDRLSESSMGLTRDELEKISKVIKDYEDAAGYEPNYSVIDLVRNSEKTYAVFSDNFSHTVNRILGELGILERFQTIVCRDDVASPKPSPEGLWRILKALRVDDKAEAIFIGDGEKDELAARAAGIEFANVKSVARTDDGAKRTALQDLDAVARSYDPTSPEKDFDYWLLRYDFETLKKFLIGDTVIELGCGRGIMTEMLAKVVRKKLIVVEGSEENLIFVKRKLGEEGKIEFYHSLWQDFEYREEVSDVVFLSGLEHLSEKDGRSVLEGTREWMADNSKLHLMVPNMNSLHRRTAWHAGIVGKPGEYSRRDAMLGHKTLYTKERLFSLLNKEGYRILHWEGVLLKPFPNHMMMRLSLTEKDVEGLYNVGKELPDYCAHIYVCCSKTADSLFRRDTAVVHNS